MVSAPDRRTCDQWHPRLPVRCHLPAGHTRSGHAEHVGQLGSVAGGLPVFFGWVSPSALSRSREAVRLARELVAEGLEPAEVARRTGLPFGAAVTLVVRHKRRHEPSP